MPLRWKRWIAVLLLALAGAGASAAACAMACAGDYAATPAMVGDSESPPATGDCPLAQLCDFVVTPAMIPSVATAASLPPAYVAPLTAERPYRRDAEPPLKPPAA